MTAAAAIASATPSAIASMAMTFLMFIVEATRKKGPPGGYLAFSCCRKFWISVTVLISWAGKMIVEFFSVAISVSV